MSRISRRDRAANERGQAAQAQRLADDTTRIAHLSQLNTYRSDNPTLFDKPVPTRQASPSRESNLILEGTHVCKHARSRRRKPASPPGAQPVTRTIDPSLIRTDAQRKWLTYLESPHWRGLRVQALQAADRRCQQCGCLNDDLRVHHKHYRTVGHEALSDLQVLCPGCSEATRASK